MNRRGWLFIVATLLLVLMLAGCRGNEKGTGKISGIVSDDERYLPKGVAARTYEGASISIYKAVEAGTYKLDWGSPAMKNYEIGDQVKQVTSGKGGAWTAELPEGKYFIRAFMGKQSYSGDIFVDVPKGAAVKLDISLISGV